MKRYADLLEEAKAEYARQFRALGDRAARYRSGPGTHRGRMLDYDPWCRVCGRATRAKGYCLTHYVNEYRKAARRKRGLRYIRNQTNIVCGHLDRRHHAHGRCRSCDQRVRRGIKKQDGGPKLCVTPSRPPHAVAA